MNLLDRILSVQNFNEAIKEVAKNKGAPGIDGMTVDELQGYFAVHGDEIRTQIRNKQYRPQPVRRVYIPKPNSDKLISILRERMNDATILHLIRSFLKAGVMDDGLVSPTEEGVPQGGPLSCVLSNVYLDKLDKELETRADCPKTPPL